MHNVGNDIVDLNSPRAVGRSRDKRFVDRILTASEKESVFRSTTPDAYLWAFWAAKEAAYKSISKSCLSVSSQPRRYAFHLIHVDSVSSSNKLVKGHMNTPIGEVNVQIELTKDYCHAVATGGAPSSLRAVVSEISPIEDYIPIDFDQSTQAISEFTRNKAKLAMAAHLGIDPLCISIRRDASGPTNTPPLVYYKNRKMDIDLSLSHDGGYTAVVFYHRASQ